MGEPIAEMEFGLSNEKTLETLKPDIKKNDEDREADLLHTDNKKCDFSSASSQQQPTVQENIFGNTSKESNATQMKEDTSTHMSKNVNEKLLDMGSSKNFPHVKQIAEIDFGASGTHALETLEAMQEDIKKRNEEAEMDPKISAIHQIRDNPTTFKNE